MRYFAFALAAFLMVGTVGGAPSAKAAVSTPFGTAAAAASSPIQEAAYRHHHRRRHHHHHVAR